MTAVPPVTISRGKVTKEKTKSVRHLTVCLFLMKPEISKILSQNACTYIALDRTVSYNNYPLSDD